jgi:hypothetical protein
MVLYLRPRFVRAVAVVVDVLLPDFVTISALAIRAFGRQ